ncbi:hypothetical protein P799_19075 [Lysinibacillus sphaericus CBAM5]|uniref:Uncharacterized protein n=1 Tax=Lysinibacillus sphaericus CBAM5 TaxID=1400869 RepID=W7RIJ1_LYSSH|nr:hypothetical protein P799_20290 [Lysinibacillus sphaericus CBAM5]EWH31662.1 hypothetical protein P799_19075 [Lysinibacillus sphaericus CBAM5]
MKESTEILEILTAMVEKYLELVEQEEDERIE